METKTTADVPLTEATSDLMSKIEHANSKARTVGMITIALILLLVALGVIGIYKQNQLAAQAKDHIDCIIKDLSTPIPANAKSKYIDYQTRLSADCHIKFVQ